MDKAIFLAVVLFQIVALTTQQVQPVLRPWIVNTIKYLYRYILLPYATFWLDHFNILCGIVAAFMFYYMIRVFYTEWINPFTEMAGCGHCDECKKGNPICEHDPGNASRQCALNLKDDKCSDGCPTCLLSHYVEEFRKKLTKQNVDDLREHLHQKGVLDGSDMDELHRCLSSMSDQLSVMFRKLSKKENGYDKLIEVLRDLDEEQHHNNWFGDLADELMTKFCRECRKRYPKGYPTLYGIEFFTVKTFSTSPPTPAAADTLNTTTTINWPEHGVSISFPRCFTQVEVTIGVTFDGYFKLPHGAELVTPVYNITTVGIVGKPINVELKHCAVLRNSTDEALLNFVKCEPPHEDKAKYGSYDMDYCMHSETNFSRYHSHTGMTTIPPCDTSVRSFLLAIVKSKVKRFKFFSRELQSLYRLRVFYSRPRFITNVRELESTVVATMDLPSYTEMLEGEFPSDRFSSGQSTVACLGEDGLSIKLPKEGEITNNRWRVTPTTNRKLTRHQIDYRGMDPTFLSPSITLKLKWLGDVPLHYQNDVKGEQLPSTPWLCLPELDHTLIIKGTKEPFRCDFLQLHIKPDLTERHVSEPSSTVLSKLSSGDESTSTDFDIKSAFTVWTQMLKDFKLRFRMFVYLSMEISVPGAYPHVYVPNYGAPLKKKQKDNLRFASRNHCQVL